MNKTIIIIGLLVTLLVVGGCRSSYLDCLDEVGKGICEDKGEELLYDTINSVGCIGEDRQKKEYFYTGDDREGCKPK